MLKPLIVLMKLRKNATACGICDNCRLIAASKHQDVIELTLPAKLAWMIFVKLLIQLPMPVSSKYKIYIIDEIHMLSNSAFNALLKTLEEPPAHVNLFLRQLKLKSASYRAFALSTL